MKRRWALLALALPLLMYLLAIVKAEYHLTQGEIHTFAISGYDPRDLLRGHYLRFQVDFDWAEEPSTCPTNPEQELELESAQECCLCLMKTEGPIPKVFHTTCQEARVSCDGALRPAAAKDLHRYYIPEEQAQEAERLIREGWADRSAHILVSITPDGEAQIVDLQIDGHSLDDLLRGE